MSGDGYVPTLTSRKTGGFRRTAGLDSSRPWSTARSMERAAYSSTKAGMTTPTSWENTTIKQVNVADTHRQWSTGARWTARNTQDHSDSTNKKNLTSVHEALLAKTQETRKLVDLLSETLRTINHEIAALEAIPSKRISSYIRQTEEKIELNLKRLEVRKQRPKHELVDDDVHAQLLSMDGLLKTNLAQLLHCQKSIVTDLKRLKESKHQLEADLANKRAALDVDSRVLNDANGTPEPPRTGATGNSVSNKMTIYPATWVSSTQSIVKAALQRQGEASKLRLAIDNCCQDVVLTEKTSRQNLQLAAMEKLAKTQGLKSVLSMEREQVISELERAREHDRSICEQIIDLEDSMEKTRRQYTYRCQRPDVEKVVDEVELTMKRALTEQKALHKNLMNSRPTLTSNIAALQRNLSRLDKNLQEKSDCIEVDEQALMIDGRKALSQAPSMASYRTSYVHTAAGSSGSRASKASSIKSRISSLEDDLAMTRRTNDLLESRRNELMSRGALDTSY